MTLTTRFASSLINKLLALQADGRDFGQRTDKADRTGLTFFVRGLLCVCVHAYPPRASSIYFIYCSPMRITRRTHSASGLSFLHLLSYEDN